MTIYDPLKSFPIQTADLCPHCDLARQLIIEVRTLRILYILCAPCDLTWKITPILVPILDINPTKEPPSEPSTP